MKQNLNYTILIDFIERSLDGYEGLNPTQVGTYDTFQVKYFELYFTKADRSQWKINARVFKLTSVVLIDS